MLPHWNLFEDLTFHICDTLHVLISKAILMAFVASQVLGGVAYTLCTDLAKCDEVHH